jgi:ABC-type Mn2+/Zn2+ transport system permease subunit
MMALAAVVAVAGSLGGLYLSYYANLAAGASVAAVFVGAYLVVLTARAILSLAGSISRSGRRRPGRPST